MMTFFRDSKRPRHVPGSERYPTRRHVDEMATWLCPIPIHFPRNPDFRCERAAFLGKQREKGGLGHHTEHHSLANLFLLMGKLSTVALLELGSASVIEAA